jgi:NTP pyrophosphatase (non-canonical NTP hydrolase)
MGSPSISHYPYREVNDMDLVEYRSLAQRTANPSSPNRLAVAALGLVGETAELIAEEDTSSITLELGDVMWYVAELSTIMGGEIPSSDSFAVIYKNLSSYRLCIELVVQTGGLADYVKKVVGHGHGMDPSRILSYLDAIVQILRWLANRQQFSFEGALEQNIDKLRRRYPDGFQTEKSISREV